MQTLVIVPYFRDRIFSEVTDTDQGLLNDITSLIVDHFAPRSRIDASFQATWAFIATWFEVADSEITGSSVSSCLWCCEYHSIIIRISKRLPTWQREGASPFPLIFFLLKTKLKL